MDLDVDLGSNWKKPVALAVLIIYLLIDAVLGGGLPGSVLLRPLFGIVLLTVVPGGLLVALLGLGDRPLGRLALYTVGLSLSVVVVVAIVLNGLLSLFVARPLSPVSLTVAVALLVVGLSGVRYAGVGGASRPLSLSVEMAMRSLSRRDRIAVVAVSLLPVASALLTLFTGAGGTGWLLIALLGVLSIVPLLLLRWQGSPVVVPYAIWAVSASVLLQMTLVSSHLWGFDIHFEYFTAANILHSGHWEPGNPDPTNSLVMITLLGSVYSWVSGLELVWVYKLVYPLLVSLLPLGVWYIVRSTFEDRSLATLAPFALVFYYGFFKDMPDKQLVAGLFAVLLLVVFLDAELSVTQRWSLGIAFAIGLTFSHYGVSLLFVAFLGGTLVARYGIERLTPVAVPTRLSRPALVGVLGGVWILWYLTTASGVNFYRVVGVGSEIVSSLPFQMAERSGVDYATTGFASGYWVVYKLLHVALVGLIGIGLLSALYVIYTDADRPAEYTVFSTGVFAFLVSSVVFTFGMGFDRTFQIALFVVSPFAIVGARSAGWIGSELLTRLSRGVGSPGDVPEDQPKRSRFGDVPIDSLFAVFLAVLFLFSSGTVFALGGEQLPPYNINVDEEAGWPVYSQSEVEASRWLANHTENETVAVYNEWDHIKSRDGLLVSEVIPMERLEPIWLQRTTLNESAYVYVSQKPMRKLNSSTEYIDARETPFYNETLSSAEVVYENENVTIYYVDEQ